jgi:hypothetical protein
MENYPKGLLVEIMGTPSNRYGVTSNQKTALLIGENIEGELVNLGKTNIPILKLVKGYGQREYMAIPFDIDLNKNRAMFGGQFVYSSDSRFPSEQPIHVHNWFE